MRCDVCGSNDSVFFVKPDSGGGEIHVCRACAVIKGYAQAGDGFGARLDSFFNEQHVQSGPCPRCAWTEEQLASTGLLGCTECSKVYRHSVISIRKRAGAIGPYEGKVPRASNDGNSVEHSKADLSASLEHALRTEDFEAAAKIRDRLRASTKGNTP